MSSVIKTEFWFIKFHVTKMPVQVCAVNQMIDITRAGNSGNTLRLNGAKKFESVTAWNCFKIKENSLQINTFELWVIGDLLSIKWTGKTKQKTTPWPVVRKRTIQTERPPLVGEVSANFWRKEGVSWSAHRIPTAVNLGFLDGRNYFLEIAPQLSSRGWVGPVPD
jgi:hypothetical protein